MQNLYPLFGRNRIVKTEHLQTLCDYSFARLEVEYQEYYDGIVCGCAVWADGKRLHIGPGMVKFEGFISLISKELLVEYTPTDEWCVLKMRMSLDEHPGDVQIHRLDPVLDDNIVCGRDELEVCRFKLRKGSQLRSDYQSFVDMVTEYDTINLLSATWGSLSGITLAPAVTNYFARLVLAEEGSSPADIGMAYHCLDRKEAVSQVILRDYVVRRQGLRADKELDNRAIYEHMIDILAELERNRNKKSGPSGGRRPIVVE
jgi:hypothetical protein